MPLLVLVTLFACSPESQAPMEPDVVTEDVTYEVDGVSLRGYIAYDQNVEGERPGVIVVHEWWGHNDYARMRAEMLAELGYTAMALDMYGDGKIADHPNEAGAFVGEIAQNIELSEKRFAAALELLKQQDTTDPERIAAIGYCFGGSVVLHEARIGTDLDAVVGFHAGLDAFVKAEPGSVTAKVQVNNGAADPMIPAESVEAFKAEMEALGADWEYYSYEGALHSFTNPAADSIAELFGMPVGYDAAADSASWEAMQRLFDEVFSEAM
ncbi:MAG: dienelactone hydrolase family protein [Rhodothermales bacterium]|nr:dienelactone hydrolase family protein [Rhodothermales bacterium]